MSHFSNAWFHRIKAAQRDLIKMCGGIERVSLITSVSSSHVGRWNNVKDTDLMPISAIITLEADCSVPVVTTAMADLNGFRVEDPEKAAKVTTTIMSALSETVQQAGELFAAGAAAAADGLYTPAELHQLDRCASTVLAKLSGLRNTLAAAHDDGDLRTVSK